MTSTTIDPVAPKERSLIRVATPYLEVETQSISSLERTIMRDAQASPRLEGEEAEGRRSGTRRAS